jgi:hypothetical protein
LRSDLAASATISRTSPSRLVYFTLRDSVCREYVEAEAVSLAPPSAGRQRPASFEEFRFALGNSISAGRPEVASVIMFSP